MEDSKLIKTIWRFNAYVIALAGILAIGVFSFASYQLFKDITRDRHTTEIVNIDPETKIEEKLELGAMERIAGSKSIMVPLNLEQEYDLLYSGKQTRSIRNFLFSNFTQKKNHWLLETNSYLISYYQQLRRGARYENDTDILAIAYEIIKSDTNKDKRLTSSDLLTISLTTPEGERYTELLIDVEHVNGYEVIDEQALAILYKRGGQTYIAHVSLKEFKITSEIELSKIKKQ